MSFKEGRSEDYKKGYQCGYTAALQKINHRKKKEAEKQGNLLELSKLRLCERGIWIHIEGDDNTYICPFCENHTYCEGDYVPKFCMECGNELKEKEDEQ